MEKQINPDQAHAYQITLLTDGQYLRITALQKGINVGLTLLLSSGQKLVVHDKSLRVTGIETFSVIARGCTRYI